MNPDLSLSGLAPEILWTIVIVAAVILANIAISAILRGRSWLSRETKLRAAVFWRNFSLLVAFIALIFVWRAELRAAALSLAALSVAVVLVGKEMFTSVLGYIHRTTSGSFGFGDVIEIEGAQSFPINEGTCMRYNDLARLDIAGQGGRAALSVFRGQAVQFPLQLAEVERHPLGSQAFMPMGVGQKLAIIS